MSVDSLLPDNRTLLETALEKTLGEQLQAIPVPFPEVWSPKQVPVALLPWLAQAKGLQHWDAAAPESEHRLAVASIWPMQREGGTRAAIRRALEAAGFTAEIVPWYRMQPAGTPYSLQVTGWAESKPITEEQRLGLLRRLQDAVSERDEITVRVGRQSSARPTVAASIQLSRLVTVQPYVVTELNSSGAPNVAAGVYSIKTLSIQASV